MISEQKFSQKYIGPDQTALYYIFNALCYACLDHKDLRYTSIYLSLQGMSYSFVILQCRLPT
jgi:hypothetical protein